MCLDDSRVGVSVSQDHDGEVEDVLLAGDVCGVVCGGCSPHVPRQTTLLGQHGELDTPTFFQPYIVKNFTTSSY